MKWPSELTLIRHDRSRYNELRDLKGDDELYQRFVASFEGDPGSPSTVALAERIRMKYRLGVRDASTELVDPCGLRPHRTGVAMARLGWQIPDAVFISPYVRTQETWRRLWEGFTTIRPNMGKPPVEVRDERVREQDHGLATLYSDWRVFHTLHPEQRELYNMEGSYWYRYPQGENVPDVRERNRSWLGALTRDYVGQRVWVITHHLNILATVANLERLDEDGFIHLDDNCKPANCSVTVYRGDPAKGSKGKLVRERYAELLAEG